MATTVVCDVCPDEPGWSGESSAAEWQVTIHTKKGAMVTARQRWDSCALHLGDAVKKAADLAPSYEDFQRITVEGLETVGG